jgi:hypothetical protein
VTTPSRGRRGANSAKRSIHFFRIDGGADDSGVPIAVDLHPALQKFDGLPFRNAENGGRYVDPVGATARQRPAQRHGAKIMVACLSGPDRFRDAG